MKHFLLRTQRLCAANRGAALFSDLWLSVAPGEVTGVIGLDAEGKSALTAILSGRRTADSGILYLHGERYPPEQAAGLLYQNASYVGPEEVLADHLSLSDNLFVLGQKRTGRGVFRWLVNDTENHRCAQEYLSLARLDHSPDVPAGHLNADEKHRLEFLRALIRGTPFIVFNTPLKRAELVADESAFCALLDYARSCGVGIVMMFNSVDRLMRLCDRAAVVRAGRTVCLCEKHEFQREHLTRLVHGSSPAAAVPSPRTASRSPAILELRDMWTADKNLHGLSLCIHSGEIAGILCKDDEWNGWFVDVLQGKHPLVRGQVLRRGVPVAPSVLSQPCSRNNRAFFVVGSENLGLLQHMNALDNLLLPIRSRLGGPMQLIGPDIETHLLRLCLEHHILSDPAEASLPVSLLSTEKKLRIWIGRAHLYHPDLCIFLGMQEENDPVLRALVHAFAKELAASGAAVLMLSTQKHPMSEIVHSIFQVDSGRVSHTIQS